MTPPFRSVEAEANIAAYELSRRSWQDDSGPLLVVKNVPQVTKGSTWDTPNLAALLNDILAQQTWEYNDALTLSLRATLPDDPEGSGFGARDQSLIIVYSSCTAAKNGPSRMLSRAK